MPILVTCQCGAKIRAPEKLAGQTVFCPQCSEQLTIPASAPVPAVKPAAASRPVPTGGPKPVAASRPVPTGGPKPAAGPRRVKPAAPVVEIDEEPPDERPRRRAAVEPEESNGGKPTARNGKRQAVPKLKRKAAQDQKKRMLFIGGGVAAVLFLGLVMAYFFLGSRDDSTGSEVAVTADDILGKYRDDEAAADRTFQGSILDVTGIVAVIGKDPDDKKFLELKGTQNAANKFRLQSFNVKCLFRFSNEKEISTVAPGQTISVRGRCDGKSGDVNSGKVVLKDSRLLKVIKR
jgi:hypothetical protein